MITRTPSDIDLIQRYGTCRVCGAPRNIKMTKSKDSIGRDAYRQELLCTSHPAHGGN